MAKFCRNCGKKLSFFSRETICKDCKKTLEAELSQVEKDIMVNKRITDQQLELLKKQDKQSILNLYSNLFKYFEADRELEDKEIEILDKIQDYFNLTEEEVKYKERIRPYLYVNCIRKTGELPTVQLEVTGSSAPPILKKGEIVHYADWCILKELKSVSLGYRGGSQGVSIQIMKGVRYRVGGHRGHIVREERYVDTSQGLLIISNQRLFLHPLPGYKPLSIPLKKILSYHCFENGIELYKEGREKGYFFATDSASVEIFGICLSHLLSSSLE